MNTKRLLLVLSLVFSVLVSLIPVVRHFKNSDKIKRDHAQLDVGPTSKVKGRIASGRSGGSEMPSEQIRFPIKDRQAEVEFFHPPGVYYFGDVEVEYLESDPSIFRVGNGPNSPMKVSREE